MNRSYCRSKFYIAGIRIFDLFGPVTLILTRWPSYTNLTQDIPQDRTWTSYVKAFEIIVLQTDRRTDTYTYIRHRNYIRRRFEGGQQNDVNTQHTFTTVIQAIVQFVLSPPLYPPIFPSPRSSPFSYVNMSADMTYKSIQTQNSTLTNSPITTSAKEVVFSFRLVCLFVCLFWNWSLNGCQNSHNRRTLHVRITPKNPTDYFLSRAVFSAVTFQFHF